MRLVFDMRDDPKVRDAALLAMAKLGRPDSWKVGYGWAVRCQDHEFWIRKTKTGYSVREMVRGGDAGER